MFGTSSNSSSGLCSSEASFLYCASSLLLWVKLLCNSEDKNLHDLTPLDKKQLSTSYVQNRRKAYEIHRVISEIAITSIFQLSDSTAKYFSSTKIQEFKELARHSPHAQRPCLAQSVTIFPSMPYVTTASASRQRGGTPGPGFLRSLFFREDHSCLS